MITIIQTHNVTRPDGKRVKRVHLLADPTPDSLQLTGADLPGVEPDAVLAAGSTLRTPERAYLLYVDGGTFK